MAKRSLRKETEPTEAEIEAAMKEMIDNALSEIEASILIAEDVFGTKAVAAVRGVCERVFIYEDAESHEEVHTELKKAKADAVRLFDAVPTVEQVFFVYDWAYAEIDDEDEDEEE